MMSNLFFSGIFRQFNYQLNLIQRKLNCEIVLLTRVVQADSLRIVFFSKNTVQLFFEADGVKVAQFSKLSTSHFVQRFFGTFIKN